MERSNARAVEHGRLQLQMKSGTPCHHQWDGSLPTRVAADECVDAAFAKFR
jgi:hypothetical protein